MGISLRKQALEESYARILYFLERLFNGLKLEIGLMYIPKESDL